MAVPAESPCTEGLPAEPLNFQPDPTPLTVWSNWPASLWLSCETYRMAQQPEHETYPRLSKEVPVNVTVNQRTQSSDSINYCRNTMIKQIHLISNLTDSHSQRARGQQHGLYSRLL